MKLFYTESISKFRIISIYVTTTIIGILLVFAAVYNASSELEIFHEIDHMHDVFSSLVENNYSLKNEEELVSALGNKKYKVYLYPTAEKLKIGTFAFSTNEISESQINERGGYFTSDNNIFTWTLIPLRDSENKILIAHQYQPISDNSLFLAYKNRLIIPAVFFIWMTVWSALVLSNLVKQILIRKEEAEYLALHDPLTELANRNLFTEKLDEIFQYSVRHHHSFCLAVIDLDEFKSINDTYGHNVGDELLKQVAGRFKKQVRRYDVVARLGGDEFVILLPESNQQQGLEIYQRIYESLIEPYTLLGNELTISASFGIAVFPKHSQKTLELIHQADNAMYIAKNKKSGIEVYAE